MTAITGDAADTALIQSVCERAKQEHGRLDLFFANAGTTGSNLVLDTTDEDGVMDVMRVNLLRCGFPFFCWRATSNEGPSQLDSRHSLCG